MKLKHIWLFLALVLATAGPAFADHIAAGSKLGDGDFISNEESSQTGSSTRTSDMRLFKEGNAGTTEDGAVQFCNSHEKKTDSDVGMPSVIGTDSDDHKETLADFGSKHGKSFGKHDDKDWDDGVTSVVAVPEPGSQLLLLVGLMGLGMSLYLRHLLRIAS